MKQQQKQYQIGNSDDLYASKINGVGELNEATDVGSNMSE